MIVLSLMFVLVTLSSLLITKFDLASVNSNELDEYQKDVGYIVLILLSLNVGMFALTCGLVENMA